MKKVTIIILCFLIFTPISNAIYKPIKNDYDNAEKISNKIEKIISEKGEVYRGIYSKLLEKNRINIKSDKTLAIINLVIESLEGIKTKFIDLGDGNYDKIKYKKLGKLFELSFSDTFYDIDDNKTTLKYNGEYIYQWSNDYDEYIDEWNNKKNYNNCIVNRIVNKIGYEYDNPRELCLSEIIFYNTELKKVDEKYYILNDTFHDNIFDSVNKKFYDFKDTDFLVSKIKKIIELKDNIIILYNSNLIDLKKDLGGIIKININNGNISRVLSNNLDPMTIDDIEYISENQIKATLRTGLESKISTEIITIK